jgi:hypothetical protein
MHLTKILQRFFAFKTIYVFIAIFAIYALALTIEFEYIFTDKFYYQEILDKSKNSTLESITQFITRERHSEWINYPFVLAVILIPSLAISFILYVGSFISEFKLHFKTIFSIVLKSQIVFALNYLLSVLLRWFGIINYDINNVNNNYRYQSALAFFDVEKIPNWLHYPLQCINLSEIVFLFVLSFGLAQIIKIEYSKALKFTSIYYGFGLLFWIVCVLFIRIVF